MKKYSFWRCIRDLHWVSTTLHWVTISLHWGKQLGSTFPGTLPQNNAKLRIYGNLQQNTICSEQKFYPCPENFTHAPQVVHVTNRMPERQQVI